jgi:hypothetical protein
MRAWLERMMAPRLGCFFGSSIFSTIFNAVSGRIGCATFKTVAFQGIVRLADTLGQNVRQPAPSPCRSPTAAGASILACRMRRVASLHEVEGLLVHQPLTLRE